jgi:magnesium chelatase family protein
LHRYGRGLANSVYKFPFGRTPINLAPADVTKEGPSFDLPIPLGILAEGSETTKIHSILGLLKAQAVR